VSSARSAFAALYRVCAERWAARAATYCACKGESVDVERVNDGVIGVKELSLLVEGTDAMVRWESSTSGGRAVRRCDVCD
jgi:hypothetical protein